MEILSCCLETYCNFLLMPIFIQIEMGKSELSIENKLGRRNVHVTLAALAKAVNLYVLSATTKSPPIASPKNKEPVRLQPVTCDARQIPLNAATFRS